MAENKTTDFGYQQIPIDEKTARVSDIFDSVAARYDLMNDLMSIGIHRIWKQFAMELSGVRSGHHVLDIAGGTGDLAARFSRIVGDDGRVVLADINASMLAVGRDRLTDRGEIENICYVQADAQCLPFADNSFDCVSIAFGLRNITDKIKALGAMHRVLRPGGRLLILEFSKPESALLNKLYDAYSFQVLPRLGKLIANDSDSYRYLAESIRMHPDQQTLKSMVMDCGFEQCTFHNLSGGIVAIHRGLKK
jgi:demethylmenaquinone methyltransferase / 2-methoxy-6-polyprenyl-1,4-benzoquinol methylase